MNTRESARKRVHGAFHRWVSDLPINERNAHAGVAAILCEPEGPDTAEAEPIEGDARTASEEAPDPEAESQQQSDEPEPPPAVDCSDWYAVLQINRNADAETIHRVYRIMAARFHPDNPRTGNVERFLLMKRAYHVLSDPERRAAYDALYCEAERKPLPVFELKEFIDGVDGEKNRRLGVLSLLYHHRRINVTKAGVSLLELEQRMALPREYLEFTLWYLRARGLVTFEDNSDYAVTADGVDYAEGQLRTNGLVRQLLEAGPVVDTGEPASAERTTQIPTRD